MKASKAKEIFNMLNKTLTVEEQILRDVKRGFAGTSVPKMCENHPQLEKLKKKGYLITHSNTYTYITWAY